MPESTYISPSRRAACSGCGKTVQKTSTSADAIFCRDCRARGLAPSRVKHGTDRRYASGCRCEPCTAAKARSMRRYTERRRVAGNPIDFAAYRSRVPAVCEHCATNFMARTDVPGRFCSVSCAQFAQGKVDGVRTRWRISRARRFAIYERDGWVCQLCFLDVARDESRLWPRSATLDHILPRALGGSDADENLRLACRDCNTRRGVNLDWVPQLSR